jgi:hypothetical protein
LTYCQLFIVPQPPRFSNILAFSNPIFLFVLPFSSSLSNQAAISKSSIWIIRTKHHPILTNTPQRIHQRPIILHPTHRNQKFSSQYSCIVFFAGQYGKKCLIRLSILLNANGSPSPQCPRTILSVGYVSKIPETIRRSTCAETSELKPHGEAARKL